jgi:hypothetical protein
MMGQAASFLDCGIAEALVGESDWVVGTDGVRRSDARVARDRQRTMEQVRAKIVTREQLIQRLEMDINQCQRDALACRTRLQQGTGLTANDKRLLMARAKRALQTIAAKQASVRQEQIVVQMARSTLDKIEHVSRGDDTRQLFSQLSGLTSELQLDEGRTDDLAEAGNDVLESHSVLDEYGQAMNSTVDMFDSSMASSLEGEFDLNKPGDLMSALDQLSSSEPVFATGDATAWAGATGAQSTSSTAANSASSMTMPDVPRHTVPLDSYNNNNNNNNRGPSAGPAPQLTSRKTADKRLEVFF